ncbi:hypothetical protein R3P38DRAFT_2549458, partial [Favolaschia claudopus]
GAFQIGVLISCVLLGVTTLQAYVYYTRFPDDSLKLKALVMFVWFVVCEVAHTICVAQALYQYTVLDFGHPEHILGRIPVSLDTAVFFSALIKQSVECFYASRIYTLSHQKLCIPIIILFLAFIHLAGNMWTFAIDLHLDSLPSYLAHWTWLSMVMLSVSATNSLLISTTLVVLLYVERNFLQLKTVVLVDKVIVWTIGLFVAWLFQHHI